MAKDKDLESEDDKELANSNKASKKKVVKKKTTKKKVTKKVAKKVVKKKTTKKKVTKKVAKKVVKKKTTKKEIAKEELEDAPVEEIDEKNNEINTQDDISNAEPDPGPPPPDEVDLLEFQEKSMAELYEIELHWALELEVLNLNMILFLTFYRIGVNEELI